MPLAPSYPALGSAPRPRRSVRT